jgi:D-sedoheptulose 7-phosphate isomerase
MRTGYAAIELMLEKHPLPATVAEQLRRAASLLVDAAGRDALIMSCGNGGSAADADHMVAELMKGFLSTRPLDGATIGELTSGALSPDFVSRLQRPIRAVSLCSNAALLTAIANDQGADAVFAQQVLGYGRPGDVLVCISTSGSSVNVVTAAVLARARGLSVIGLTGPDAGTLDAHCNVVIEAPGDRAGDVQDVHRPVIHALCAQLETTLFG